MNTLTYIALGAGVGVLYCWAFAASRTYKRLVVQKTPGAHLLPLLNKFAAISIALCSLVGTMIIIGADRSHSWIYCASGSVQGSQRRENAASCSAGGLVNE